MKIQLLLKLHWKFDTALKESFHPGGKSKAKILQECKYADVTRIRVLHIFFCFCCYFFVNLCFFLLAFVCLFLDIFTEWFGMVVQLRL